MVPHAFEEPRYFEGCLPIEVMAERGDEVLAFGPMKPVGLVDPRTGKQPHAVVQLRRRTRPGTAWNLVGFQTRLTWPEQKRIFAPHPRAGQGRVGAAGAGAPQHLHREPAAAVGVALAQVEPRVFFAGQITGVEGYVESTACGYLAALGVHAHLTGTAFAPPPAETALGALYRHVTGAAHPEGYHYQPTNVVFALFPPLVGRMKKADKRVAYSKRAVQAFDAWAPQAPHPVAPMAIKAAPAGT